ncbi:hypothetical protein [Devosia sp. RR2S18]|uniref:hypothetical protein n=1 Tax=Devosia rhizosphaerae TaxID=3049774 RepID=UPI00253F7DDE|nr:hypothetical protein [Devosia sp. RR2S18]WIJ24219.1 hypothetical protein QOV41_14520 [Devosia sp. RR2S18]
MGKAELLFAVFLLFTTLTALAVGPTIGGEPDTWLYHYQTLFAGLLALVSAIGAAVLLYQQTRQTAAIEWERKQGQREAARSWLSLHLSAIVGYAKGTGQGIWYLMGQCHNGILPGGAQMPDLPPLPMEAALAVKEFAEFATREEAQYLALMFATMQVLESRVSSVATSRGMHYANLEDYLEDAAELYARAEVLLHYARHTTQTFPPGVTWDRYCAALLFITDYNGATERIARHIDEGAQGNMQSLLPNRFQRE